MTNEEMLQIAISQSAIDANCQPEDFLAKDNKVVISVENPDARKYLVLPLFCNLISYGNNIVASVHQDFTDVVRAYIDAHEITDCFTTPAMHKLNDELEKRGMRICYMAEYFLPDIPVIKELPCNYPVKILEPADFQHLYTGEWSNALEKKRKQFDVLAAGANDSDRLIGLAGCSADCDSMWQIGIDVNSEYRKQGIAAALTSRLAIEILKRDKVPFYCAAWSNMASVRNALKCGFRPAWIEMTAKPVDFVRSLAERNAQT